MQINKITNKTHLSDGKYTGTIKHTFEFTKGNEPCLGIEIGVEGEDRTVFTTFVDDPADRLAQYPWSLVFDALNTRDTDDLEGVRVEFDIKNKSKDNMTFSNIRKIRVLEQDE